MLPQTCEPEEDPAILERLYPRPLDPDEPEDEQDAAEEDWSDYVRPELETAFDENMLTVMTDLAEARLSEATGEEIYYCLEVPGDHLEAWFQVLNRARIVLSLKHRLPLSEYPPAEGEKISLQRLLAAHLSDYFAEISEIFVLQLTDQLS